MSYDEWRQWHDALSACDCPTCKNAAHRATSGIPFDYNKALVLCEDCFYGNCQTCQRPDHPAWRSRRADGSHQTMADVNPAPLTYTGA